MKETVYFYRSLSVYLAVYFSCISVTHLFSNKTTNKIKTREPRFWSASYKEEFRWQGKCLSPTSQTEIKFFNLIFPSLHLYQYIIFIRFNRFGSSLDWTWKAQIVNSLCLWDLLLCSSCDPAQVNFKWSVLISGTSQAWKSLVIFFLPTSFYFLQ